MPASKRSEIIAEFANSGMTGVAFAAMIGVKYQTFAGWLRRSRLAGETFPNLQRGTANSKPVRFVEAQAAPRPVASALTLELPGGGRLCISDRSHLPLAIELLRSLRPC